VDIQIHVFFISALVGGEWLASLSPRFTPRGNSLPPGINWLGGWQVAWKRLGRPADVKYYNKLAVPGHELLWPFPVTDRMISLRYVPRLLCPFPQEYPVHPANRRSSFPLEFPRVRRLKFDLLLGVIDPCLLHHCIVRTNIDTPDQESIYLNSLKFE
jgi:hypothetical protein